MIYREAFVTDIPQMQIVRNSVIENTLSNPALIKDEDYIRFICNHGKGWVCEWEGKLVGFAIVDLMNNNVWALFVLPEMEGRGIARQLQSSMLEWYFSKTKQTLWLGTAPQTRAEVFYKNSGWKAVGLHGADEIKFEMTYQHWKEHFQ